MDTHPHAPPGLDRLPLMACAALVVATLLGVGWVRYNGQPIRTPDADATVQRALRFEDRMDGSIAVIDPLSGQAFETVSGQAGFVRGTLRGLARERRRMGLGAEQPFVLTARADGRLTLHDPATGRIIDLDAFGPLNASAFARLLPRAGQGSTPTASPSARSPS